jgi:hypothetical protein
VRKHTRSPTRELRLVHDSSCATDAALGGWIKLREAFLLKHGEGLEYSEIASLTGASESALKMRVKRACEQLRPCMEEMRHE